MEASGGFPPYAVGMVATGEQSGHLEDVLRNLEMYYDEESRLFAKLRQSVSYPAALLVIMCAILAFSTFVILPVFSQVYESMASSLAAGSLVSVGASRTIGLIALGIVAVCAVAACWLAFSSRTIAGQDRVMRLMERLPLTREAMYQLALSRFTASLAAYVSSGITSEEAMLRASEAVEHEVLRERLARAHEAMVSLDDPRSLAQAIGDCEVFEPLYARMLNVGIRSGSSDEALAEFSEAFFDDAVQQIDHALDLVEPLFAAFLTVSVGITLIAVMLPLVGIMRAIG
jgi:type IV pilus assembly protein PilC